MLRKDQFGDAHIDPILKKQLDLAKKPPPVKPMPEQGVPMKFPDSTCVLIATGPSLNQQHLDTIHAAHTAGDCHVFTINNTYQVYPETDVHLSCDGPWWLWYWNDPYLREIAKTADLWTWYPEFAEEFGINYVYGEERLRGLSLDPRVVHINHGSGPMILNLALLYGAKKIVLIGHDMKFAPDYKPEKRDPGSIPRHYFGEYPRQLQHWPSVKVRQGILDGLIEAYSDIKDDIVIRQISVDVVNCTPGSALTMFRQGDLEKEL
jgi:hypothetical protein